MWPKAFIQLAFFEILIQMKIKFAVSENYNKNRKNINLAVIPFQGVRGGTV